ncbi:MAG TPA: hypothetical protein VHZ78_08675 [Rhizomicrobium sp.]|jgi:hypothetical protein|nr:hypothetical protein [Rhizomicrobium sp.]
MTFPLQTLFTLEDAIRASDEWGANCGPGALAAIMHLTLEQVRPHMIGFEGKGYTNPTMMFDALRSIGRHWRRTDVRWPRYGLARIQWEGPWTKPGVPLRARYRQTHWVGSARSNGETGIFDINAIGNGTGWCSEVIWANSLVPHILKECVPRADGRWHITHAIEVEVPR